MESDDRIKKDDFYVDFILNEIDERRAVNEKQGYGLDAIVEEYSGAEKENRSAEEPVTETAEEKETEKKDKVFSLKEPFDWAESIVVSIISIVIAMTFLFRLNEVYGVSMQPTLYEGDRLIVLPLLNGPEFGDIVVVEAMHLYNSFTGELGEPIVKRVIGVEGDTIFIDPETGDVYRNGELLNEKYIFEKINVLNIGNQTYPLTVKENEVFVMGDNRNHSTDSRYKEGYLYYVDCVGVEYVLGKAVFRIWPPENIGGLY